MEQENNKEKLGPEFLHSNEYQEKMKVKHDQTQNRVNKFPMIMHCLVILFFMAGIYAIYDISKPDNISRSDVIPKLNDIPKSDIVSKSNDISKSNKEIIGAWEGRSYTGDLYSFSLVKNGLKYELEENGTNGYRSYHCTKYNIKKKGEYYLLDPDRGGVLPLDKGRSIYIIDNFDYDPVEEKEMKAILIIWSSHDVRIYSDYMVNGTMYYLNDYSNLPVYECYAKLNSKADIVSKSNDISKSNKEIIGAWEGRSYTGDLYSFSLVKNGLKYELEENGTNGYRSYHCTKYNIKKKGEYYLLDPDRGGVLPLDKGRSIYIIDNFDYDPVEEKEMKAILIIWSSHDVRIYSDYMVNGTMHYLNDYSNLPVYECYAKLH
ncbi:hypothetical protein [Phocaeicola sartorii]|uniref:hypothetical protein n=1 Tax=Phocaeicola sartorii TaxID=671267 RepID=UPI002606B1B0|nr:hypothetical protein [Phocaeicola sartorii]